MKSRIIEASARDIERAAPAHELAWAELTRMEPSPPRELVGDLLLALSRPRPKSVEVSHLPQYSQLFRGLVRGRRWGSLVLRLGQLQRTARGGEARWRQVAAFLAERLAGSLMRITLIHNPLPLPGDTDACLELIAQCYMKEAEAEVEVDDFDYFSKPLLDDVTMVLAELARRVRTVSFINLVQDADLVEACLRMASDSRPYKPRFLREVLRHGDRAERLPGDLYGLRGVTKKIREDQIPKVLPSEMAAWHWRPPRGQRITLDRVVNGSPPCYQHYDTRRPELDHRMLLLFLVGTRPDTTLDLSGTRLSFGAGKHVASRAEVNAKALAFSMLVNAALKIPHHLVRTDFAWFQREDKFTAGMRGGIRFPLSALKVTSSASDSWRNLVEVDRYLPRLLVRVAGAITPDLAPAAVTVNESPSKFLLRAATAGYDAVFIVALAQRWDLGRVLPTVSVTLPRLPTGLASVMLVSSDDEDGEGLRGETFRDLLSAHLAPGILAANPGPLPAAEHLNQLFLEMILGPLEHASKQPGHLRIPGDTL
jgi:hypothetical protein